MSASVLVKKSKELGLKCQEFAGVYTKLIGKFKAYNTAPEIDELESYWGLAIKVLKLEGTVSEMIGYFLKYQELIMANKVDELLAVDFAKEIKPGTNQKTVQLITALINIFKHTWTIASNTDKTHIKMYIQLLTKKSADILALMEDIENTK